MLKLLFPGLLQPDSSSAMIFQELPSALSVFNICQETTLPNGVSFGLWDNVYPTNFACDSLMQLFILLELCSASCFLLTNESTYPLHNVIALSTI